MTQVAGRVFPGGECVDCTVFGGTVENTPASSTNGHNGG